MTFLCPWVALRAQHSTRDDMDLGSYQQLMPYQQPSFGLWVTLNSFVTIRDLAGRGDTLHPALVDSRS